MSRGSVCSAILEHSRHCGGRYEIIHCKFSWTLITGPVLGPDRLLLSPVSYWEGGGSEFLWLSQNYRMSASCPCLQKLPRMMTIVRRVSKSVHRLQTYGESRYPCLSLFSHLRLISSNSIAKLPSPLKDLVVASATHNSINSELKPEVN